MNKLPAELFKALTKLTPQEQRLFTCDCAEHVLSYFEGFQPDDKRPRMAIETSRRYALGQATLDELKHAAGEAEGAARPTDRFRRGPARLGAD